MKSIIILLVALICLGCISKNENSQKLMASLETKACKTYEPQTHFYGPFDNFKNNKNPYDINLKLDSSENEVYHFIIDMHLNNGAYFVSPNSKREFSGVFKVILNKNDKLEAIGNLEEHPLSVEEDDPHPYVNGKVNWVRQNTTYTQKMKIKTNKDFSVNGVIQFTIEPRCTLEKIPIVIFQQNGKLKFEIDNC